MNPAMNYAANWYPSQADIQECMDMPGQAVVSPQPHDSAVDLLSPFSQPPESQLYAPQPQQSLQPQLGLGMPQQAAVSAGPSNMSGFNSLLPAFAPLPAHNPGVLSMPQQLQPFQHLQPVQQVHPFPPVQPLQSLEQQFEPVPQLEPQVHLKPDKCKTRAETQIKVELDLENLPSVYQYIRFPRKALAKPKLLASADELKDYESKGGVLKMSIYCVCATAVQKPEALLLAKQRARGDAPNPRRSPEVPISQIDKDDPSHPQNGGEVFICDGCKERERKRHDRKKKKPDDEDEWNRYENERVILINEKEIKPLKDQDSPSGMRSKHVDFHMRIACYCRHQEEKSEGGYRVIFTFTDPTGKFIVDHVSQPFQITDDHKNRDVYPEAILTTGPPPYQPQYMMCEVPSYPSSRRQSQTPMLSVYSQPATPMASTFSQPQTPVSMEFSQPPTPITGTFAQSQLHTPASAPFDSQRGVTDFNFSTLKQELDQFNSDGLSGYTNNTTGLPHTRGPIPHRGPLPAFPSRHSSNHLPLSQAMSSTNSSNNFEVPLDFSGVFNMANKPRHVRKPASSLNNFGNSIDAVPQQFGLPHQQNGFGNSAQPFAPQLDQFPRAHSMVDLASLNKDFKNELISDWSTAFSMYPSAPNTAASTPHNLSRPPSPNWVQGPAPKVARYRNPPGEAAPAWAY